MMRLPNVCAFFLLVILVLPIVLAQSSSCITVDSTTCQAGQVRRGGGTLYYPDGTTKVGSLCCTPVCGDGRKEGTETCESDSQCGVGERCAGCSCVKKEAEDAPAVPPTSGGPTIEEFLSQLTAGNVLQKAAEIKERKYGENMPALPSPVADLGPGERTYYRKQCLDSCERSVKSMADHCEAMRTKYMLFLQSLPQDNEEAANTLHQQWRKENEFAMLRACEFSLRECQQYCFEKIPSLPGEKAPKAEPEKTSEQPEETSISPTGPPESSEVDEETRAALERAFRGDETPKEKPGVLTRVWNTVTTVLGWFGFGS